MSFIGSEKRVRDAREPFGRRVMCLHECLEQFNLFGFNAPRERLRIMVEADGEGWTEPQLIQAMDLLASARSSWAAHLARAQERRRQEKQPLPPSRPLDWQWHNEWLEGYLVGDVAVRWMVTGLGDCPECGHLLIHHGTWACTACDASDHVAWDARCRVQLPPAGLAGTQWRTHLPRRRTTGN